MELRFSWFSWFCGHQSHWWLWIYHECIDDAPIGIGRYPASYVSLVEGTPLGHFNPSQLRLKFLLYPSKTWLVFIAGFPFHGSLPKQFHNTHPGNLSNKCYRSSISNCCIETFIVHPKWPITELIELENIQKFPVEKQRETSWHQANHFTKLLGEGSGSDWS